MKNRRVRYTALGVLALLVGFDLAMVDHTSGRRLWQMPEVDTDQLGEATVTVVCSECPTLADPANLVQELTYEQV